MSNQNCPATPPTNSLMNCKQDKSDVTTCHRCGGQGHYASQCPTKVKPKSSNIHHVEDIGEHSEYDSESELLKDQAD